MEEKRIVFTSELVNNITKQISDGYQIPREMNPWWAGEVGVRKSGLSFSMTKEEIDEYLKCAVDIHHFAETYCKIKAEDGKIKNISLRDYQKDILDLYNDNRFSILCGSRQIGKCLIFNTLVNISLANGSIIEIPFYKLFYKAKKKKTFLDRIKYLIYWLIDRLEKRLI